MNFSEEQIQTLQDALKVIFEETSTEFVRPKMEYLDQAEDPNGLLREALLQYLCEDAYETEPGDILELLSSSSVRGARQ
jgi:hypothetical protein